MRDFELLNLDQGSTSQSKPLTSKNITILFNQYLSRFHTYASFEDKEDNVFKLLKSDDFAKLSKQDQFDLLNKSEDEGFPPIYYIALHKADNVLEYLFDKELVDFKNRVAIDILFIRKYGNSTMKYLQEDVIKRNLKLYLEKYYDLTLALYLPNSTLSKKQLTLIINNSNKGSLFYEIADAMLSKIKVSYNFRNEIIKLSTKQQHILVLAYLLDIEIEKRFNTLINTDEKTPQKTTPEEININNHCPSNQVMTNKLPQVVADFVSKKSLEAINVEHNNSLLILMNLAREYLAPANQYLRLYNDFITIIKDKLLKIDSVKSNSKNSIFRFLDLENIGDAETIIYYFLSGKDIDVRNPYNYSLLIESISRQTYEIIQKETGYPLSCFLIIHGANLNLVNSVGDTALNIAASKHNLDAVKLLLFYKADSTISNKEHRTPLISAVNLFGSCEYGLNLNIDLVRILINCSIDSIYKVDKNGQTLLHRAANNRSVKVTKLLLDAGVDVNIKDKKGHTALDLASQKQTLQPISEKVIELLQDRISSNINQVIRASAISYVEKNTAIAKQMYSLIEKIFEKQREMANCNQSEEVFSKASNQINESISTQIINVDDIASGFVQSTSRALGGINSIGSTPPSSRNI